MAAELSALKVERAESVRAVAEAAEEAQADRAAAFEAAEEATASALAGAPTGCSRRPGPEPPPEPPPKPVPFMAAVANHEALVQILKQRQPLASMHAKNIEQDIPWKRSN